MELVQKNIMGTKIRKTWKVLENMWINKKAPQNLRNKGIYRYAEGAFICLVRYPNNNLYAQIGCPNNANLYAQLGCPNNANLP